MSRNGDLSRDDLVAATLALIEEHGIDAVTMRDLATKIGTSPMAPYRHIQNKQALLELAADAIYERIPAVDARLGPWERVQALFESILDISDVHPWTVDVLLSRELTFGSDTPSVERVRTEMLGLLGDVGFSPERAALAAETTAEVITGSLIQKRLRAMRAITGSGKGDATSERLPPESDIRSFTIDVFLSGLRARLAAERAHPARPRHARRD